MGIQERREREKQITRQAILTAALTIAKCNGWGALTIRKVAEQIEYSPPMVYEYFASKEAMLLELAHEGFDQLRVAMMKADRSTDDSEVRLYNVAFAYWDFAITNPELYHLMHGSGATSLDKAVLMSSIEKVSAISQTALVAWAEHNAIDHGNAARATELLWCLLHGFVTLHLLKRIAGDETEIKTLLEHALHSQMIAWKTTQQMV
ncbi:MAG: TetR/AcrR family transcriptional regulator [Chloroflexi bacterium AL-W]|nr:TetR/AcrR family transcriptional regulator [Chloroflexi bacterium AL-N1]NOK70731.1 TetR/AcrR family transcriptional regulator [Chloroflexi bacterium AL-N10]NOK78291.1 TetR/AcrR family transcriptional regulator [Chloroflexi bacterium AL-N5]NOK85634.1 TetR/AcrR family transcriptional regulator [Chloroflexi bacterium AL-W]NOK92548.1 TetR/AcrR family transcriptional regulator [Chloroflexi bacterium AL-N15]